MPLFNFSDLAMLWPFANEADKTLFVYKQHEEPSSLDNRERLPNNERAILVLTGALGRIVMDDSSPDIRMVGPPGDRQPPSDNKGLHRGRHVIYVGGPGTSIGVANFFSKCEEQGLAKTAHFPGPGDAAVLRIAEDGERPRYEFKATYHDRQKTRVQVDYGLAVLTYNPVDTAYKALLVAGLYGPGTLAAAEAISGPEMSRDFIQPIVANFHLPPHLLGTVEVVVETKVDREGELVKNDRNQPDVALRYIAVNGLEVYPSPDLRKLRIAYPTWPCEESQVLHVAKTAPSARRGNPLRADPGPNGHRVPQSRFGLRRVGQPFAGAGARLLRPLPRPRRDRHLSPQRRFGDRLRRVGLLPSQSRDLDTPSSGEPSAQRPRAGDDVKHAGVSDREFGKYCDAIGIGPQRPPRHSSLHAQLRSQIRRNEAHGENFLLDAETHWMDLAVDEPENVSLLANKLKEVRRPTGTAAASPCSSRRLPTSTPRTAGCESWSCGCSLWKRSTGPRTCATFGSTRARGRRFRPATSTSSCHSTSTPSSPSAWRSPCTSRRKCALAIPRWRGARPGVRRKCCRRRSSPLAARPTGGTSSRFFRT